MATPSDSSCSLVSMRTLTAYSVWSCHLPHTSLKKCTPMPPEIIFKVPNTHGEQLSLTMTQPLRQLLPKVALMPHLSPALCRHWSLEAAFPTGPWLSSPSPRGCFNSLTTKWPPSSQPRERWTRRPLSSVSLMRWPYLQVVSLSKCSLALMCQQLTALTWLEYNMLVIL